GKNSEAAAMRAAIGLILLGACGGGDTTQNQPCEVTGVAVAPPSASVSTGETVDLTATVTSSGSCAGGVSWSASPSGGTPTPNGTHATFSASAADTYTVSATSSDDASRSGSAAVTVTAPVACGTPNGTVVDHTRDIIADETWAGDGTVHTVSQTF